MSKMTFAFEVFAIASWIVSLRASQSLMELLKHLLELYKKLQAGF